MSFVLPTFISTGALNNLKRNNVKLHDNILVLMQDNAQWKKERKLQMKIICDLREEIKILVSILFNFYLRAYLKIKKKHFPRIHKRKSNPFQWLTLSLSWTRSKSYIFSIMKTDCSMPGVMDYMSIYFS